MCSFSFYLFYFIFLYTYSIPQVWVFYLFIFFMIVFHVALSISSPSVILVSLVFSLPLCLLVSFLPPSSICKHHYQQRHGVSYRCVDISSPLGGSVVVVVVLYGALAPPQLSLIDKTVYKRMLSSDQWTAIFTFFFIGLYIFTIDFFPFSVRLFEDDLRTFP